MEILVVSDLHLGQWREHAPRIGGAGAPDIVVLAGDIDGAERAVAWAAQTFPEIPVLYVQGNHEFYGSSLEQTETAVRAACARHQDVHLLQCDEYLSGGVRFLGCTLWTDFGLFGDAVRGDAMRRAQSLMYDYKRIRIMAEGGRLLEPADTVRLHARQRAWLQRKLDQPFDGKTVVVTHMAPSLRSVEERYATDPVSAAFASNLDELVAQADLWIHGHTHGSFDYRIGKCRVVCNPCGYRLKDGSGENPRFDPGLTVELASAG